jgi:hypothetical protein
MNTHKIAISMEDTDIEKETTTLLISTNDNLAKVCEELKTAFNKYDRAEGVALDYREEYGWGIYGFICYIDDQYDEWDISTDNPDITLEFIGM